jgi:hypothetical protein
MSKLFRIVLLTAVLPLAGASAPDSGQIHAAPTDSRCDAAYAQRDYESAIPFCAKAAAEYDKASKTASTPLKSQINLFFEAACLYQVSLSYMSQDDPSPTAAEKYARWSFSIVTPILNDAIFRVGKKDPRKVYSAHELHLLSTMAELQANIVSVFPEIGQGV